jgi:hypothetical protein
MLEIDGRLLGPMVGTTLEPGRATNGITMSEVLDRECRGVHFDIAARHGMGRAARFQSNGEFARSSLQPIEEGTANLRVRTPLIAPSVPPSISATMHPSLKGIFAASLALVVSGVTRNAEHVG